MMTSKIFPNEEAVNVKRIILNGQPVTKKNHQQICKTADGRRFVRQNQKYCDYEQDCLWQLNGKGQNMPEPPYQVSCVYYMQTRRKCDLVNLLEATDDILVRAGIIADDNFTVLASHDGSRVRYDKDDPRVEITITHFEE